jgi:hypothetical protein
MTSHPRQSAATSNTDRTSSKNPGASPSSVREQMSDMGVDDDVGEIGK